LLMFVDLEQRQYQCGEGKKQHEDGIKDRRVVDGSPGEAGGKARVNSARA
jgi:hypothetical protein